jgi:hypothetical protein
VIEIVDERYRGIALTFAIGKLIYVALICVSALSLTRGLLFGIIEFGLPGISLTADRHKDPGGFFFCAMCNVLMAVMGIYLLIR